MKYDTEIRSHIIQRFKLVERLMICRGEFDVLLAISKKDEFSSNDLVQMTGASPQSCSQRLKKLYVKGYVDRHSLPDPTGGYYYVYTIHPSLKNAKFEAM